MKKVIRSVLRAYCIACGFLVIGFLVLSVLNSLLGKCVTETHAILGFAVRPSVNGSMHTVIVGERTPSEAYPDGVVMVYGEVEVDEVQKYPIGTKITYSLWKPWIWGDRGWGQIIKNTE